MPGIDKRKHERVGGSQYRFLSKSGHLYNIKDASGNEYFKSIAESPLNKSYYWNILASAFAFAVGVAGIFAAAAVLTTPVGWAAAGMTLVSGLFWGMSNIPFFRRHLGEKTCNRIAATSAFVAVICAGVATPFPVLAAISSAIGAVSCYAWYSDSHFLDMANAFGFSRS